MQLNTTQKLKEQKIPWFRHLLWHILRKQGGLIPQP